MAGNKAQLTAKQRTYRCPSSYSSYVDRCSTSIIKFVTNVSSMSKSTAYEYFTRLSNFETFLSLQYDTGADDVVRRIKEGFYDPYDILSNYSVFMQNNGNISVLTLKQRVITAKNFLEYYDIDISPRKFELKVKLPKTVRRNKEALSKEVIIDILNACSDIRLKTYVMFLACTGCRAVEALSIRYIDLDEASNPAKILIRGEFTKTKVDRVVLLTSEMTKQLKLWWDYKHRTRRVCYKEALTSKTITEYRTPKQDPNALIFAVQKDIDNFNIIIITYIYL